MTDQTLVATLLQKIIALAEGPDVISTETAQIKRVYKKLERQAEPVFQALNTLLPRFQQPNYLLLPEHHAAETSALCILCDEIRVLIKETTAYDTALIWALQESLKKILDAYVVFIANFLSTPPEKRKIFFKPRARIHGPNLGFYYIQNELAQKILCRDQYGYLIKENKTGNHPVARCGERGGYVHFKPNPEGRDYLEPAAEYFAYLLYHSATNQTNVLSASTVIKVEDVSIKKILFEKLTVDTAKSKYDLDVSEERINLHNSTFPEVQKVIYHQKIEKIFKENPEYEKNILIKEMVVSRVVQASETVENGVSLDHLLYMQKIFLNLSASIKKEILYEKLELIFSSQNKNFFCSEEEVKKRLFELVNRKDLFLKGADEPWSEGRLDSFYLKLIHHHGYTPKTIHEAIEVLFAFPEIAKDAELVDAMEFKNLLLLAVRLFSSENKEKPNWSAVLEKIIALKDQYDSQQYSAAFVGSLLINPKDLKADNFMAVLSEKKWVAISFDNDKYGKNSISMGAGNHYPEVKNVLLGFFNKDDAIDKKIRSIVLNRDPTAFALYFLSFLHNQNKKYLEWMDEYLIDKDDLIDEYEQRQLDIPLKLEVDFLTSILEKYSLIYEAIKRSGEITHQQLFSLTEPVVARLYGFLHEERGRHPIDVIEFFYSTNQKLEDLPAEFLNILLDKEKNFCVRDALKIHKENELKEGVALPLQECIKFFLGKMKVDLDNLLLEAVIGKNVILSEFALDYGAKAGSVADGKTPIFYATDERVIQALLEYGADPDFMDPFGKTALDYALLDKRIEQAAFLIGAGAGRFSDPCVVWQFLDQNFSKNVQKLQFLKKQFLRTNPDFSLYCALDEFIFPASADLGETHDAVFLVCRNGYRIEVKNKNIFETNKFFFETKYGNLRFEKKLKDDMQHVAMYGFSRIVLDAFLTEPVGIFQLCKKNGERGDFFSICLEPPGRLLSQVILEGFDMSLASRTRHFISFFVMSSLFQTNYTHPENYKVNENKKIIILFKKESACDVCPVLFFREHIQNFYFFISPIDFFVKSKQWLDFLEQHEKFLGRAYFVTGSLMLMLYSSVMRLTDYLAKSQSVKTEEMLRILNPSYWQLIREKFPERPTVEEFLNAFPKYESRNFFMGKRDTMKMLTAKQQFEKSKEEYGMLSEAERKMLAGDLDFFFSLNTEVQKFLIVNMDFSRFPLEKRALLLEMAVEKKISLPKWDFSGIKRIKVEQLFSCLQSSALCTWVDFSGISMDQISFDAMMIILSESIRMISHVNFSKMKGIRKIPHEVKGKKIVFRHLKELFLNEMSSLKKVIIFSPLLKRVEMLKNQKMVSFCIFSKKIEKIKLSSSDNVRFRGYLEKLKKQYAGKVFLNDDMPVVDEVNNTIAKILPSVRGSLMLTACDLPDESFARAEPPKFKLPPKASSMLSLPLSNFRHSLDDKLRSEENNNNNEKFSARLSGFLKSPLRKSSKKNRDMPIDVKSIETDVPELNKELQFEEIAKPAAVDENFLYLKTANSVQKFEVRQKQLIFNQIVATVQEDCVVEHVVILPSGDLVTAINEQFSTDVRQPLGFSIYLWDVNSGKKIAFLGSSDANVVQLFLLKQGIAFISKGGVLHVVDICSRDIFTYELGLSRVSCVIPMSAKFSQLPAFAVGTESGVVQLWRFDERQKNHLYANFSLQGYVSALAATPTKIIIATILSAKESRGKEGKIEVFEFHSKKQIQQIEKVGHLSVLVKERCDGCLLLQILGETIFLSLLLYQNEFGEFLIAGGRNRQIYFFEFQTGALLRVFKNSQVTPNVLLRLGEGGFVCAEEMGGCLLWELPHHPEFRNLKQWLLKSRRIDGYVFEALPAATEEFCITFVAWLNFLLPGVAVAAYQYERLREAVGHYTITCKVLPTEHARAVQKFLGALPILSKTDSAIGIDTRWINGNQSAKTSWNAYNEKRRTPVAFLGQRRVVPALANRRRSTSQIPALFKKLAEETLEVRLDGKEEGAVLKK